MCPAGTGSNYSLCYYPEYCPLGSNMTLMCGLGYKAVNHTGLRWDPSESCLICPAGFYGNHTEREYCEICPEGYYCPEGKRLHGNQFVSLLSCLFPWQPICFYIIIQIVRVSMATNMFPYWATCFHGNQVVSLFSFLFPWKSNLFPYYFRKR